MARIEKTNIPGVYLLTDTGRYQATWRDAAGVQRRASFTLKKDAAKKKRDETRRAERGEVEDSNVKLSAYWERWFADKCKGVEAQAIQKNTAIDYAYSYETHIGPFLGHYPMAKLRPSVLRNWQRDRLAAGAGRRALQKAIQLLKNMMGDAVNEELIERNYAAGLKMRITKRRTGEEEDRIVVLTPAQIEERRAGLSDRDATIASVMGYAGLRPQEALALEVEAVDFEEMLIHVRRKWVRGETVPGAKTDGSLRPIPMSKPLAQDLWGYMARNNIREGLLFPTRSGTAFSVNGYKSFGENFKAKMKVPPGMMRHCFASLTLWETGDIERVAKLMGHTNSLTTISNYTEEIKGMGEKRGMTVEEAIMEAREKLAVAA